MHGVRLPTSRKGRINSVTTYIAFMHRSIPEFLEDYLVTDAVLKYTRHFDFGDAQIQTFLAVTKSIQFTELCRFHNLTLWEELKYMVNCIRLSDGTDKTLLFNELDSLDKALLSRYGQVYPDFRKWGWERYYSTYWDHPSLLTPLSTASHEFFLEYIVWKLQRRPELTKASQGTEIAQATLDGCYSARHEGSPVALERSMASLRAIFKLGVKPSNLTNHADYERMTLWELLLQRLSSYKPSVHVWGAILVMLENGADPPAWEYKEVEYVKCIELRVGERRRVLKSSQYLPRSLDKFGAIVTLKDFMVMHGVKSKEILQILLRRERDEVNEVAEEVVVVENLEVTSERLDSKDNGSSSSSSPAYSSTTTPNIADQFLKSPVLPWAIVGE